MGFTCKLLQTRFSVTTVIGDNFFCQFRVFIYEATRFCLCDFSSCIWNFFFAFLHYCPCRTRYHFPIEVQCCKRITKKVAKCNQTACIFRHIFFCFFIDLFSCIQSYHTKNSTEIWMNACYLKLFFTLDSVG